MKPVKAIPHTETGDALQALKMAVVEGASWRYEHLVALAVQAGATDEDIDTVAHEALEALLTGAELPLTQRMLGQGSHGGHFRS